MNEHDVSRRRIFAEKNTMADLIRGFVDESWVAQLDFDTLERVSGSFVSDRFKPRENDIIWRVRFRGEWLYVYLLLEFQSTVDRFMALRLMVYVGLLYQQLIAERRIDESDGLLPPVLPIVLYNGSRRWSAPFDIAGLMADCPGSLSRYRPHMRYLLLEEHAFDNARLAGMRNLAALVFRFEQCSDPEEFTVVIDAMVEWAAQTKHRAALKRIARWVRAILDRGRVPAESMPDLDDIEECGVMLKERVEEWKREFKEEGIREGIEKGIEKGEATVLMRQLTARFGELDEAHRSRIEQASADELLVWAERILTADKISDVFGD